MSLRLPENFDERKLMVKYGVRRRDIKIDENGLVCDALPELKAEDLADCVAYWTKVPKDFDGQKFMEKFGVDRHDFRIDERGLICDTLPDLTEADIADCVTDWTKYYEEHPNKAPRNKEVEEFLEEPNEL